MSALRRVAIVGSGPSGIFTADFLTGQAELPVQVDLIDRLPIPFGLVRYGVAPDHISIRNVRDTLWRTFERENLRFLGNVSVGTDITAAELRDRYDAVVYAYGAASDRHLDVPGEELAGIHGAIDVVRWYTGHPDAAIQSMTAQLRAARSVAIFGLGNVAVDLARILAKSPSELEGTDIPQHVLDALRDSAITDIHLVGRRGPAFGTFTTKELRELGELAEADVLVDPRHLAPDPPSERELAANRVAKRNFDVIKGWSERQPAGRRRRVHLHFLARPVRFEGQGRVERVVLARTAHREDGSAADTGEAVTIDADVVIRAVGYRGQGLCDVPHDGGRGVIPNRDGRVLRDGVTAPGEYCTGWIRRGPKGIIGANKMDAEAVAQLVLADLAAAPERGAPAEDIKPLLEQRGVRVFEANHWPEVDAAEKSLGATRGRDRTSLHSWDLLRAPAAALSGDAQLATSS
ncbi:FAD-dependent oxidoreductase [Paracoccus sp. J55]|uniref:FAD-dependent oxidoreductase n=1 Tax=Paracoccus sp. J55 TaxID=935849 RepID=UPI0004B35FDC|nr:FAD-dependent oxidoreductase [Paracoccus sp. J55]